MKNCPRPRMFTGIQKDKTNKISVEQTGRMSSQLLNALKENMFEPTIYQGLLFIKIQHNGKPTKTLVNNEYY